MPGPSAARVLHDCADERGAGLLVARLDASRRRSGRSRSAAPRTGCCTARRAPSPSPPSASPSACAASTASASPSSTARRATKRCARRAALASACGAELHAATAVEPLPWSTTSLAHPMTSRRTSSICASRRKTTLRRALDRVRPAVRSHIDVLVDTPVARPRAVQRRRRPARLRVPRLRPARKRAARRRVPPARPPRRLPGHRRPARHGARARGPGRRGTPPGAGPCLTQAARRFRSVRSPRPRVVIAGGGVAAIEALLALRHLVGEQVSIQLLAPDHVFVHRPSSVARPFGLGGARADRPRGARPRSGRPAVARAAGGRGSRRAAWLSRGRRGGALRRPDRRRRRGAEACGPGAITFAGPGQAAEVAALLDAVERGESRRLVFAVPAGATWSLPVYELAMMAAVDLRDRGVPERDALARDAGGRAAAALRQPPPARRSREMLDARGIALLTDTRAAGGARRPARRRAGPPLRPTRSSALPALGGPARSPGCPPTRAASSPSTRTAAWRAPPASTPPATPRPSRSSRAASPPSRPTPSPRRSPRTSASVRTRRRSAR